MGSASASWAATTRKPSARPATSSRSMFSEIKNGNTSPRGGLYISMSHLGADNVRKQFKGMVERCADCGFDLAGGLVEVVPTAHYMMGGVEFAADCRTGLPGLFVAGEDSGGVHGANRAFNLSWHDWMNLKNLVAVSRVIAAAAIARKDSRGAHIRSDFPETGPLDESTFTSIRFNDVAMKPVKFTRVRPGQTLLKDAA